MSNIKARYRMAHSLEEAAKLLFSKSPKGLSNFRAKQKLWEDGVYENATDVSKYKKRKHRVVDHIEVDRVHPRSAKAVTLPTVKWLKKDDAP